MIRVQKVSKKHKSVLYILANLSLFNLLDPAFWIVVNMVAKHILMDTLRTNEHLVTDLPKVCIDNWRRPHPLSHIQFKPCSAVCKASSIVRDTEKRFAMKH